MKIEEEEYAVPSEAAFGRDVAQFGCDSRLVPALGLLSSITSDTEEHRQGGESSASTRRAADNG
jgi:hypothetical protein